VLTFYLVTTALLTVRRRPRGSRWIDASAMVIALAAGIFSVKFGLDAAYGPKGKLLGFPATPALVFGIVALLAALGDARLLMGRNLQGAPRIARHLWRMCLAMFIATGSFFLGQAKVFSESMRILPVLAIPVVLVLLLMFYWWVRVSFSKRIPQRA
jgi:peptidoglycan/LPS O-acetylase OafA/YrhL